MANSYTDGEDFTTARQHGDLKVERPFVYRGDSDTAIVTRTMRVYRDNYVKASVGASLSGFFGVRLIEETPLIPISVEVSEYNQIYSSIPKNWTDYTTALYVKPPAYGSKVKPILFGPGGVPQVVRRSEFIREPSESIIVNVRLEYSYTTAPRSTTIREKEGFILEKEDSDSYPSSFAGVAVTLVDDGITEVTITGDQGVIESTQVKRWRGDIFEVVTGYRF